MLRNLKKILINDINDKNNEEKEKTIIQNINNAENDIHLKNNEEKEKTKNENNVLDIIKEFYETCNAQIISKIEEFYSRIGINEQIKSIALNEYENLKELRDVIFNGEEENEQSKIDGLFQQIGDYKNNVFSAVGSLDLLEKLLNAEYNPDYEIYINIYKNMKIYEYKYMKLNDIIKNNIGGNKTNVKAMKLLHLIFRDKKWEKYKNEIITDENVFKQYTNYSHNFSE